MQPTKTFCHRLFRHIVAAGIFLGGCTGVNAQAQLILHGGAVVLANNATLVIANSDNNAIQRSGSGYILSEGEGNRILWAIGNGNGNTYTLPFGTASRYFPVSFKASSGTGSGGYFVFSSFPVSPVNSGELPSGVTNMTITTGDNSLQTLDRFWQIKPIGYSTAPNLTDLSFSYSPTEIAAPNEIAEANLTAFRWNGLLQKWNDFIPPSIVNTTAHTVTVSSIGGNQLSDWWTLADATGSPLPVTLLFFTARPVNGQVLTNWQTAMEENSDHYEVWRSRDDNHFDLAGSVSAAGSSNTLLSYSFTDIHPYSGISYYKLKSVDRDARFTWSATAQVELGDQAQFTLYPNPATSVITIISSAEILASQPNASLYNIRGQRLKTFPLTAGSQSVDISTLASGVYQLEIHYGNQSKTLRFEKL